MGASLKKYVFGHSKGPYPIIDLSVGNAYNSAIQVLFTVPYSSNPILRYDCYIGGVFKQSIFDSGEYITLLTKNTSYSNIKLIVIDNQGLTSIDSNVINSSTANINYATSSSTTESTAFITASGISVSADVSSTEQLIYQLIDKGLWSKIYAGWIFKGTSSNNQKYNIKNPVDSNAAFRLVFTGTGTFSSSGYLCTGSTAWADTFFVPPTFMNVNNAGLTTSIGTNNANIQNSAREIGSEMISSPFDGLSIGSKFVSGGIEFLATRVGRNPEGSTVTGSTDAKGIATISSTALNKRRLFKNKDYKTRNNLTTVNSMGAFSLYIGRLNASNTAPAATQSTQRIQIALVHQGLTDGQVIQLHEIIDESEQIAGRKTW